MSDLTEWKRDVWTLFDRCVLRVDAMSSGSLSPNEYVPNKDPTAVNIAETLRLAFVEKPMEDTFIPHMIPVLEKLFLFPQIDWDAQLMCSDMRSNVYHFVLTIQEDMYGMHRYFCAVFPQRLVFDVHGNRRTLRTKFWIAFAANVISGSPDLYDLFTMMVVLFRHTDTWSLRSFLSLCMFVTDVKFNTTVPMPYLCPDRAPVQLIRILKVYDYIHRGVPFQWTFQDWHAGTVLFVLATRLVRKVKFALMDLECELGRKVLKRRQVHFESLVEMA